MSALSYFGDSLDPMCTVHLLDYVGPKGTSFMLSAGLKVVLILFASGAYS